MFRFSNPGPRRRCDRRPGDRAGCLRRPAGAEDLNPPPPDFLTCKPLGAGTICTGSVQEVKVAEPQPELVCGSGADAFLIHDNAAPQPERDPLVQRRRRPYQARHPRGLEAGVLEQPAHRQDGPVHTDQKITTVLAVPGDFGSAAETTVGENIYTDPATHKKVLRSAGRVVFGADGALDFRAGQQPFLDAFVDGDMSVFDAVCAALA